MAFIFKEEFVLLKKLEERCLSSTFGWIRTVMLLPSLASFFFVFAAVDIHGQQSSYVLCISTARQSAPY